MSGVDQIGRNFVKELTTSGGHSVVRNIGAESFGFVIAEGVSMASALGIVAVLDVIPGVSDVLNVASRTVGKLIIEPNLDAIEKIEGKICKLNECQVDTSIPREERAQRLAHTLTVFGISALGAYGTKVYSRRMMNRTLSVPVEGGGKWPWQLSRKELAIFGADEGVHYGSLILANTVAAGLTDEFIRATTNVLTKCGVPEKKAKELSTYTMIWEMPNFLGLAAGLAAIYATHKYPGRLGLPHHP